MYKYGLNGILADDMGLGKTLQALALLQKAKEVDGPEPTLVIAPTTVVFNWESEIQKFTPGLSCLKLSGVDRVMHCYVVMSKNLAHIISDTSFLMNLKILRMLFLRQHRQLKRLIRNTDLLYQVLLLKTNWKNYGLYLIS